MVVGEVCAFLFHDGDCTPRCGLLWESGWYSEEKGVCDMMCDSQKRDYWMECLTRRGRSMGWGCESQNREYGMGCVTQMGGSNRLAPHAQALAIESLLLLCRVWGRVGSSSDAHRHAFSALQLARRGGLVRMEVEATIALSSLQCEAALLPDASLSLCQARETLHSAIAASENETVETESKTAIAETADQALLVLRMRVSLCGATISLAELNAAGAMSEAERGFALGEGWEGEERWVAPAMGALLGVRAAAMRAKKGKGDQGRGVEGCEEEVLPTLHRSLDLLGPFPPYPFEEERSRGLLDLSLLHLQLAKEKGELQDVWEEGGGTWVGESIKSAREAVGEALRKGRGRASLRVWREVCLAGALSCGRGGEEVGAKLVAGAIGRGVSEQMAMIKSSGEGREEEVRIDRSCLCGLRTGREWMGGRKK